MLSRAFGILIYRAQAGFNKCGPGRPVPPDGFAPPQAPRARRTQLGKFHFITRRACERRCK